MSAQNSPMTRSAAAKLRSFKRKSDGDLASSEVLVVELPSEPASKRRRLPVRSKEEEEATEKHETDNKARPAKPSPKAVEKLTPTQEPAQKAAKDDGGSSSDNDSDDEAPEAISTAQATAASRHSTQRAHKAAEQQAAEQKRKRQDRDARLKVQAAARKAREQEAAEKRKEEEDAEQKRAEAEEERARKAKPPVSKLLPLEFLESDDEDEQEASNENAAAPPPRKKKSVNRLLNLKKPPRDRALGTTVYRVLADAGPRALAPKARKHSQNMRQQLLARKRAGRATGGGGGFLVRR